MKKFFILFTVFISFLAFSSEAEKVGSLNEIYKSFNELNEAVNTVNVEKALKHIDERIIFVNIPGTVTVGHAGIKKYFDIMLLAKDAYLKSAQFEFKIDGEPLIVEDKIAFAHGHSINHYVFSTGNKMDMPVDWTGTMIKVDNQWKVISLHVAGNVFKNPLLDKVYWMLGISFSIVLIVFCSVFYFLGKKRRIRHE